MIYQNLPIEDFLKSKTDADEYTKFNAVFGSAETWEARSDIVHDYAKTVIDQYKKAGSITAQKAGNLLKTAKYLSVIVSHDETPAQTEQSLALIKEALIVVAKTSQTESLLLSTTDNGQRTADLWPNKNVADTWSFAAEVLHEKNPSLATEVITTAAKIETWGNRSSHLIKNAAKALQQQHG